MSLSFRKSLKFGPFKINLSKGGIGVSAGVKGLRIGTGPRGNYVSAGSHGVYYRKTFGGSRSSPSATASPTSERVGKTAESSRARLLPIAVLACVAFGGGLVYAGSTQTTLAIAVNSLFVVCVCAFLLDRRRAGKIVPAAGVWFAFDRESGAEFLVAPANNAAATHKLITLAAHELQSGAKIDTQVMIEAMIGTVLLDWRGVTSEGKPFQFSPDNARLLLSQSQEIRDFIGDKAMQLDAEPENALRTQGEVAERPKLKVIDASALPPQFDMQQGRASLAELSARRNPAEDTVFSSVEEYRLPPSDLLNESDQQQKAEVVGMRPILETEAWALAAARLKLPFTLGRDSDNYPVIGDLSELPHILIGGTTGTGKSVCIDAIVASLLFTCSPEQLRFVMFDLRLAQLHVYGNLPHLVIPVITQSNKVLLACRWLLDEAERRLKICAQSGTRNIEQFNSRSNRSTQLAGGVLQDDLEVHSTMPYIVVVVDELSELIRAAPNVELAIARLAESGRAGGIHLVLSTQTARRDVITNLLKSNIPARIAFRVGSKPDSRLIIDQDGAEELGGPGDMLFIRPNAHQRRLQGVLLAEEELRRIVEFVTSQAPPGFSEQMQSTSSPAEEVSEEDEELVEKCLEVIRQEKRASTSLLQRRLRLGYTRAAQIVDILEQRGILGPGEDAKPREILVNLDREV